MSNAVAMPQRIYSPNEPEISTSEENLCLVLREGTIVPIQLSLPSLLHLQDSGREAMAEVLRKNIEPLSLIADHCRDCIIDDERCNLSLHILEQGSSYLVASKKEAGKTFISFQARKRGISATDSTSCVFKEHVHYEQREAIKMPALAMAEEHIRNGIKQWQEVLYSSSPQS